MSFVKFEADSEGRIYGHTDTGEVLPIGVKVPQFASRNDITGPELKAAAGVGLLTDSYPSASGLSR